MVLVPGMAASPAAFHLPRGRSLVTALAGAGRTVWTVDFHLSWRGRSQGLAALGEALAAALTALERHAGTPLARVDAVGHSLGGILLLALLADGVPLRRLVTLASGLDFRLGRSPLPRLMSLAPKGLDPIRLRLRRGGLPLRRVARVAAPVFGRGVSLPVERDQFHPGATSGEVIREMVRDGVRDIPLPLLLDLADLFTARGIRAGKEAEPLKEAVRRIQQPVLMVSALADRQCPPGAVSDAVDRIPNAVLLELSGYGHVDLMTGIHAQREVVGPILAFLDQG